MSSGGRTWVAVHISARVREQQWPLDNWAEVIAELTATGVGAMIVWAPGPAADPRHPGDDEKAARLIASLGENTLVVPARTATLEDLIAVLTLCRAFVGADGGAMHVAAALRLPVLALFEKKKSRWHPWRVPQELIASQTGDVSTISPGQVMEAWRRLASRIA